MDWDDLRFFLAVARTGSIRAAAKQLQLSHSTVSRRISTFEQKLDSQLFERHSTGYVLTVIGENMLGAVERMENEASTLDRQLFSQEKSLKGKLRITLSQHLSDYLFMPDLVAFTRAYPDIEFDIDVSESDYNLTKREADIAIRVAENPPEYLVGRKLARHQNGFYASLDYINYIKNNSDGKSETWVGWSDENYNKKLLNEARSHDVSVHHQIDKMTTQYHAAKAGLGIAKIACFMGDNDPQLRRVAPGLSNRTWDIWILTHQDLRRTARVRAFMDFMGDAFQNHRDLVEGLCPQPN